VGAGVISAKFVWRSNAWLTGPLRFAQDAYATASLILSLLCFVNLSGLEKAVIAIVFGVLALQRRAWAMAGVVLGAGMIVLVPALIYFVIGMDGLREIVDALARLGAAK
jgi:hypothetical protein